MLQQTQVSVVIPYFEKWLALFPTVAALADSSLEQVLKCWEGLGYYSRARNLHRGARFLVEKFGGIFPTQAEEIAMIPGIGPYTTGAILSFAFHQKAAAVDGNVLRLLSRFLACEEPIDSTVGRNKLQTYAEELLPDEEPWLVSEGLIELGALICTKKPLCLACPLKNECLAFRHHLQDELPKKRRGQGTTELIRQVAVITCQNRFAVQKGEKGKIMEDLYQFPFLEERSALAITEKFERAWGCKLHYKKALLPQRHSFTRYRAQLFPHFLEALEASEKMIWKEIDELAKLPFSSGHKRILNELMRP